MCDVCVCDVCMCVICMHVMVYACVYVCVCMFYLQAKFERLEGELKLVNSNRTALRRNLLDLTELHYILGKTQDFFIEAEQGSVLSVVMHGGLEEEKGVCGGVLMSEFVCMYKVWVCSAVMVTLVGESAGAL